MVISSEDEHTGKPGWDDDGDGDGHCIVFVFPGHEVPGIVHADGSTWKMYPPGRTAVTQGTMAGNKELFVNTCIRVGVCYCVGKRREVKFTSID